MRKYNLVAKFIFTFIQNELKVVTSVQKQPNVTKILFNRLIF